MGQNKDIDETVITNDINVISSVDEHFAQMAKLKSVQDDINDKVQHDLHSLATIQTCEDELINSHDKELDRINENLTFTMVTLCIVAVLLIITIIFLIFVINQVGL